jgi:hypothetical protein
VAVAAVTLTRTRLVSSRGPGRAPGPKGLVGGGRGGRGGPRHGDVLAVEGGDVAGDAVVLNGGVELALDLAGARLGNGKGPKAWYA